MNLSVVEHYFSDFLSCLESRRVERNVSHNLDGWETKVASQHHTTLSQALILAFLDLIENQELEVNDSFPLEKLRNHSIVLEWKKNHFGGQDSSWTPQFRTEFNQKDSQGNNSRLAVSF